jgi:hypothetical protein
MVHDHINRTNYSYVRLEVLTAVLPESQVFWKATLCHCGPPAQHDSLTPQNTVIVIYRSLLDLYILIFIFLDRKLGDKIF